jgi:hypothetical protein
MSRIIQDSDDELEGSPSPIKELEQQGGSEAAQATDSTGVKYERHAILVG